MTSTEIGSIALTLAVFVGLIHSLGYLFEKMKMPKLIGEIVAGALLGPYVLGEFAPEFYQRILGSASDGLNKTAVVLNFLQWIGVFLLMFISGSETRRLMAKENQKETAWMLGLGTTLPFFIVLGLGMASLLPIDLIMGSAKQDKSALLVLAIAVSVTSIPVISRIFYDLQILHTRFASIILASAVLEDIILWGVLAIATSIVKTAHLAQEFVIADASKHVGMTVGFMVFGLSVGPYLLKKLHKARWNMLVKASPRAYISFTLFVYVAIASMLEVNLVFAAFLAGFGLIGGISGSERERFAEPLDNLAKFSFAFAIPIYFAMVGNKLVFGEQFSPLMFIGFLGASSILAIMANGAAAKFAGFKKLDVMNLAVTSNARGGPGIVLATVAFEAGIINGQFYTTLVLTAIVTSQMAGSWLRFVLKRGWPLLSSNPDETWKKEAISQQHSPKV